MRRSLRGGTAYIYKPAAYWAGLFSVTTGGVGDDCFCADDRLILDRFILPARSQAATAGNFIGNRLCNYYPRARFFKRTNRRHYCACRGAIDSDSSFY